MIFALGFILGLSFFYGLFSFKKRNFDAMGAKIIQENEKQAENTLQRYQAKWEEQDSAASKEIEKKWHSFLEKTQKIEARLQEEKLKSKVAATHLEKQASILEKRQQEQEEKENILHREKSMLEKRSEDLEKELEILAELTKDEVREKLLQKVDSSLSEEKAKRTLQNFNEIEKESQLFAQKIVATAINRLSLPCTSELTATAVPLPSDVIKGRIIGREGRNIRYLEELCGVSLVLDDTPSAILISGFDPIRKEIAKNALQELIKDGRIHPTRIEEVVRTCQENIQSEISLHGSAALLATGVGPMHPELTSILGKLHYLQSVGQNLLKHSIEVSLLMGLIAIELDLNAALAKRIGLLHDIGKAFHSESTSHAQAGYALALKYGESKEVAHGIGAHHEEMDPLTIEGSLCPAADAISSGRPGARSLALEKTFRRMQELEELSLSFEGVTQAFALQAGKELRVIVSPNQLDDAQSAALAKELAQKIEKKIPYSGKIKITVIRQARIVSYAI